MPLLPDDAVYLSERGWTHEVYEEAGMTCLVLTAWPLPAGLSETAADVLLRFSAGYPDVAPDMWWVDPPLRLGNGGEIPNTQLTEIHLGRQWQRWSRHFAPGQWQPGIDRLASYVALMSNELRRSVADNAA